MKFARGDIILADLPYSDRTGSKVRPALIVQNDRNNARLDDVIVAMITRTTTRTMESTQLLIDVTTASGTASGLLHTSAVKCEHLLTLHRTFIQRAIGRLSDPLMAQVDECLKASLGLK
ncbi:MAG: type II toxin-antitoxin system PemK/MazF family toxin [Planctomycetes bacterium]|nr:type II toxin-antitoxin system PemK/MazF family toxin [Planctomycetota bacterium]